MHAGSLSQEVALLPVACRTRNFPGNELWTLRPRPLFPLSRCLKTISLGAAGQLRGFHLDYPHPHTCIAVASRWSRLELSVF